MLREKQVRDFQIREVRDKKKEEKEQRKQYEHQLVLDLREKIQEDKTKEIVKKENWKNIIEETKKENAVNKQIKMDEKTRVKQLDVKLAQEYIQMVDNQERKKKEEFQTRIQRQQEFMTLMEKNVVSEENKK